MSMLQSVDRGRRHAGAILATREGSGMDLMLGVGGTPEGISAAPAIKP